MFHQHWYYCQCNLINEKLTGTEDVQDGFLSNWMTNCLNLNVSSLKIPKEERCKGMNISPILTLFKFKVMVGIDKTLMCHTVFIKTNKQKKFLKNKKK